MRYLLDTHILLWWLEGSPRLEPPIRAVLEREAAAGRRLGVADISLWEIALLESLGRIRLTRSLECVLELVEDSSEIALLPISARIALEATRLPASFPHDPVDRLLAATARCHGLTLATADERIRAAVCVSLLP